MAVSPESRATMLERMPIPLGGDSIVGGPINAVEQSDTEKSVVEKMAQDYCDRMQSVLRGLAHVCSFEFPELAGDFTRLSDEAAAVLRRWKTQMAHKARGLTPEQLAIEKAMSTE